MKRIVILNTYRIYNALLDCRVVCGKYIYWVDLKSEKL